jgi:hypothetical protein
MGRSDGLAGGCPLMRLSRRHVNRCPAHLLDPRRQAAHPSRPADPAELTQPLGRRLVHDPGQPDTRGVLLPVLRHQRQSIAPQRCLRHRQPRSIHQGRCREHAPTGGHTPTTAVRRGSRPFSEGCGIKGPFGVPAPGRARLRQTWLTATGQADHEPRPVQQRSTATAAAPAGRWQTVPTP